VQPLVQQRDERASPSLTFLAATSGNYSDRRRAHFRAPLSPSTARPWQTTGGEDHPFPAMSSTGRCKLSNEQVTVPQSTSSAIAIATPQARQPAVLCPGCGCFNRRRRVSRQRNTWHQQEGVTVLATVTLQGMVSAAAV